MVEISKNAYTNLVDYTEAYKKVGPEGKVDLKISRWGGFNIVLVNKNDNPNLFQRIFNVIADKILYKDEQTTKDMLRELSQINFTTAQGNIAWGKGTEIDYLATNLLNQAYDHSRDSHGMSTNDENKTHLIFKKAYNAFAVMDNLDSSLNTHTDSKIRSRNLMDDLTRDVHTFKIVSKNNDVLLDSTTSDGSKRAQRSLVFLDIISKGVGEHENCQEIFKNVKLNLTPAEDDVQKTFDSISREIPDSKIIRLVRATNQANKVALALPESFLINEGFVPGNKVVKQNIQFFDDRVVVSATLEIKQQSSESDDYVTYHSTIVHVYDKDMKECTNATLKVSNLDVSKIKNEKLRDKVSDILSPMF